jgi:hypothetical protein
VVVEVDTGGAVEVRVVVVVSLDWSRQGCRYKLHIAIHWVIGGS